MVAAAARRVVVPHAIGGPSLIGASTNVVERSGATMGTTWRVLALADARVAASLDPGIRERLVDLVDALSNWAPDSALSRLNDAPVGRWVAAPPALLDVLVLARDVHRASGGAFDPTVGDRVAAWGFGPPRSRDRDAAIGFDAVDVDVEAARARRTADVVVDLCAIAKGYAVDRVSAWLKTCGAPHHLVEIGGELRGEGVKADATPWWVAIERPPGDGGEDVVVALHGMSIATSGDYRRYVERDGERRAHTIDPATGDPVRGGPVSATVLHADCAAADAHATALMVMPVDAGLAYAERGGLATLLVDRDLRVRTSPAFDAMLE